MLWPDEVAADKAACQRSQVTGELCITVPKVKQGAAGGVLVGSGCNGLSDSNTTTRAASRSVATAKSSARTTTAQGSQDLIASGAAESITRVKGSWKLADEVSPRAD